MAASLREATTWFSTNSRHQIDFLDGVVDGTPPLKDEAQAKRWHDVMADEYQGLIRESAIGKATLLDQYGTKNEAELFAVATECFFNQHRVGPTPSPALRFIT
jgi:Mlc titration factor MtfA (ptsG expression regulator)